MPKGTKDTLQIISLAPLILEIKMSLILANHVLTIKGVDVLTNKTNLNTNST